MIDLFKIIVGRWGMCAGGRPVRSYPIAPSARSRARHDARMLVTSLYSDGHVLARRQMGFPIGRVASTEPTHALTDRPVRFVDKILTPAGAEHRWSRADDRSEYWARRRRAATRSCHPTPLLRRNAHPNPVCVGRALAATRPDHSSAMPVGIMRKQRMPVSGSWQSAKSG